MNSLPVPTCPLCDRLAIDYEQTLAEHADFVAEYEAAVQGHDYGKIWDLKYAAGGLIDIEFIAQYLQLVHAAAAPEILDTSTARVLDKAWRLGLLSAEDAEVTRARTGWGVRAGSCHWSRNGGGRITKHRSRG